MKTKIRIYRLLFIFISMIILSSSSCKKEKNEEPSPDNSTTNTTTAHGTLMFHLHTYIDAQEVDAYNIEYTTDAGRNISLSIAQLYISDIQLEKLDGSFYTVPNKTLLKILEVETYLVGNVPAGNYKSVRFKVGLPSATNVLSPTASSDSLILNRLDMWFSNTVQPDGYVFLNVQGTIDTSLEMSGKMCPFVYKLGTNAHYKQVNMPAQNFTILPNQTEFVHMYVDYNRLFTGVILDSAHLNITTVAENNAPLATQIANNLSAIFKYE
jgi:hypothetical protein